MPLPSRSRDLRWQNEGRAYASRVENTTWREHEDRIRSLHAEGRTKNEIIDILHAEHGFKPSYGQIRKKLDRWVPGATRRTRSSSATTLLIQTDSDAIQTSFSSLQRQLDLRHTSVQSNSLLPQDEELIFRTFTSILDEDSDGIRQFPSPNTAITATDVRTRQEQQLRRNTRSLVPRSHPNFPHNIPSLPGTSQVVHAIGSAVPATSPPTESHNMQAPSIPPTTSQADRRTKTTASPTPRPSNQANEATNLSTGGLAVADDSSSEDEDDGSPTRLLLAGCHPTSSYSTKSEMQSRRRKRQGSPHDEHDPDRALNKKKTRLRIKGICCGCGKRSPSPRCRDCKHRMCEKCRRPPSQA